MKQGLKAPKRRAGVREKSWKHYLAARIFAVADVYEALTNDRPYRKARSSEKTLNYIRRLSGVHFDPRVVDAFINMLNKKK